MFHQIMIMELCQIIYKEKREEIVTCYHSISICDDALNMEIVSTLGDDTRNPSLV